MRAFSLTVFIAQKNRSEKAKAKKEKLKQVACNSKYSPVLSRDHALQERASTANSLALIKSAYAVRVNKMCMPSYGPIR